MPIARFQMPDGRIGRFEVPDGTSPEDAQSLIESNFDSLFPQEKPPQAPKQQAEQGIGRTALDQGLQGATFGFADEPMDALGAAIAKYTPEFLGGRPDLFKDQSYSDVLGEARGMSRDRLNAQIEQNPGTAITANIAGGLLTGVAGGTTKGGAALTNMLRSGNAPARIAKGIVAGAGSGALYGAGSAEDGQRLEGAGQGAVYGGAFGAAIPAVGATASAVKNAILPKVDDTVAPLVQKALDANIPLRRSQIGDSRFAKAIASTVDKIPFTGSRRFADKQTSAFNKAVLAKAGIDADKATPEILQAAKDRFSEQFGRLSKNTLINVDDDLLNKFGKIEQEAVRRYGNSQGTTLVKSYIEDILNSGGKIDGVTYQNTRSQLGRLAKGTQDSFIAGLLKDMQSALDEAAFRALPAEGKKAWQDTRRQYGAYKTIEKAMSSTSNQAVRGNISPGALATAAKTGNPNYATGAGELNDLARVGAAFVRDNVPNSGTADRLAAYGTLFGTGALAGTGNFLAPAAGLGGSILFNLIDTAQPLVRGALKKGGKAISPLLSVPAGAAAGAIEGRGAGGLPMAPREPTKILISPDKRSSAESPLLDRIAQAESGGNPDAKAATSSASGLFQFTDQTWRDVVRKYGNETGISLEDKSNPEAQRVMAQALMDEHNKALTSFLGREPTGGELYLAHFAGLGGTKRLLNASGKAKADKILPSAAQSNRSIFYDGKRARTVQEVIDLISSKVA